MRRFLLSFALAVLLIPCAASADSTLGDVCANSGQIYTDAESAAYPGPNTFMCDGAHLQTFTAALANPTRLGIGTTAPTATLDVNGDVRLSDGTQNCSHATDTGAIRFNSVTFKLQSCKNGTGWTDVGSGTAPAGSNGQIQFNSDGSALGASSSLYWGNTNKRLGVGTTTPAAPLHVNGEAIVGNTGLACGSTTAGALRYDSSVPAIEFCDGTNWKTINSASPGGITPGCGASGALSTQQQTTINVAAGCTVQFKVWGGGGGYSYAGGNGGGGGYATITLGPLGSSTTYYLVVGGGGGYGTTGGAGLSGYTGGNPDDNLSGGGGAASGVWTGSYGGTAVVIAGGGGASGAYGAAGYPAGIGTQEGAGVTVGGNAAAADGGGGGAGYPTGGVGGGSNAPGAGGSNYAATGGTTATGSGSNPGNAGDSNRPVNAGAGGSGTNGYDGAIYYATY